MLRSLTRQKRSCTEPESKALQTKLTIINFLHIQPIQPPSGDYPNYSEGIAVPIAMTNSGKRVKSIHKKQFMVFSEFSFAASALSI